MLQATKLPLVVLAILIHVPASSASTKLRLGTGVSLRFNKYVSQFQRSYTPGSAEYKERLQIFTTRLTQIEDLNRRPNKLWTAGINWLTDRRPEELGQLYGWRGHVHSRSQAGRSSGSWSLAQTSLGTAMPREFSNWTRLVSLQDVRNQGECGSCWAIVGATVYSAHLEIHRPGAAIHALSPQELLSCVPNPHHCGGNGGCKGATVELAFDWIMHNGLSQESAVPYKGINDQCQRQAGHDGGDGGVRQLSSVAPGVYQLANIVSKSHFGMSAWERLPENKELPLLLALMHRGPVSVSVAASAWAVYESGVFDGCDRDAVINHAVTLVGFGKHTFLQKTYWLIQNSWGPEWGEHGRIRILRERGDETERCGIDRQPEQGTICENGPKEVTVCGMCGILYDSVVPHFSEFVV